MKRTIAALSILFLVGVAGLAVARPMTEGNSIILPFTLDSVYVNEPTTAKTYGGGVLPATSFLAQAIRYRTSLAGAGGTTNWVFRISDGSNNCDCSVACNTAAGNLRTACSGSCTFAASASLTYSVNSIGDCATGATVLGNVTIEGRWL